VVAVRSLVRAPFQLAGTQVRDDFHDHEGFSSNKRKILRDHGVELQSFGQSTQKGAGIARAGPGKVNGIAPSRDGRSACSHDNGMPRITYCAYLFRTRKSISAQRPNIAWRDKRI
jgi:hypothetical protein